MKNLVTICVFLSSIWLSLKIMFFAVPPPPSCPIKVQRLSVAVPPEWLVEPASREVSAGESITIPCSAFGVPQPSIIWHRIGEGINFCRKLRIFIFCFVIPMFFLLNITQHFVFFCNLNVISIVILMLINVFARWENYIKLLELES